MDFSFLTTKKKSDSNANPVHLTVDDLLALRYQTSGLNISARRRVMSLLAGGYQSGFRGRGMEFAETRHYQPGDDIRVMDWRVTARTGHAHTKVFQEERERPVFVMVDFRASMLFGTRGALKSVQAARAATMLAWSAAQRGDRVGGLWFNHNHTQEIRPTGGKKGVLRYIHALVEGHEAQLAEKSRFSEQATGLGTALGHVRRVAHPGSLVFLLSDFYGMDEESWRTLNQLATHTDILAGFVYDALEQTLPPPGVYPVSDGQHTYRLDSGQTALRVAHQQRFQTHYQRIEHQFRARGLHLFPLATHEALGNALRYALRIKP